MRNSPCRGTRGRISAVLVVITTFTASALGLAADDHVVEAKHGVVAAVSPPAVEVGVATLQQGGNAVDAAVSVAFAMAVTWPSAGNIGGGGFMMVYPGKGQSPACVEYRETAPAAATPSMLADYRRMDGAKVCATPGTVAGLALAHKQYGRLPWRTLLMPAVGLARDGFVVDAALARSLNGVRKASPQFAELQRVFAPPDGRAAWQAGDRLVQPELARTIQQIADDGPQAFYRGPIADLIAAEMQAGGGLISKDDLASYQAKRRQPIHGTYRGYDVFAAPPPSGGGICLVEMLNILECFQLTPDRGPSDSRAAEGDRSSRAEGDRSVFSANAFSQGESTGRKTEQSPIWPAQTMHLMSEAMRRAYCDRARYLGDADYVSIPAYLTTKEYARELAGKIDPAQATPSESLAPKLPLADESTETTHFSVIDADGMAVANTYTLENGYGSRVMVRGGGFLLNNEMTDFNRTPGRTDRKGAIGTDANLIAPGKRMLSSQTPTLVLRDGRLVLVTGSPGGRTITNTLLCVLVGVIDFHLPPDEALAMPRLHHPWFPDQLSFEGLKRPEYQATLDQLKSMGHCTSSRTSSQGDAHTIWIDSQTGRYVGVADQRLDGKAAGY